MSLLNLRLSRCIFINYIYSNFFISTDIIAIKSSLDVRECNEQLLNNLIVFYESHKDEILITSNINDKFLYSILFAGICELFIEKEYKIIISEYTKIAIAYNLNSNIINGILQEYYNTNIKNQENKLIQYPKNNNKEIPNKQNFIQN